MGAKNAKSKFFAFLDDDDVWDKNYIKNSKKYLSENVITIGKIYSKLNKKIIKTKSENFNKTNFSLKNLYITNPGIIGSNLIIPKNIFIKIRGFDKKLPLGQDKGIVIEAIKRGYKIVRSNAKILFNENTVGERNTSLINYMKGKIKFFIKYKNDMDLNTKFLFFKFFIKNFLYILYNRFIKS